MTQHHRFPTLLWQVLLACLLLSMMAPAALAQERGDLALNDDAVCTECHDETEYVPVLSIAKTPHGTVADGRTPTCTSCHGESEAHLEDDDQPVDRMFGMTSSTPVPERNEACLGCHQGGERIHWQGSTHDANEVACASCHTLHAQKDPVRDDRQQSEVCFGCHKEQRVEVTRFSRHPIPEGKVTCSDCHNTHGTAGPSLLKRDSVNDTCYQCHAEKRGPNIWNHQPVTEDCSLCHNPHGSNTQAMLKQRTPFLCQQCHEPGRHQTGVPEVDARGDQPFGAFSAPRARGCLNCHTNIHGGNSPTDDTKARAFFR